MENLVLVKVVCTCIACPSQWDAWDADGNYYYLRYRHGCGEIRRYQTPEWVEADENQLIEVVATFEHGDPLDGSLSLEEFAGLAGVALAPEIERVAFWRHIHDSLAGEFADDPAALARLDALLGGIQLDGE